MLVYKHLSGSNPELIRLYRDASGKAVEDIVAVYQDQNSATPLVLRSVLNKMKSIFPADDYGLILWSHATGWLPEGYYSKTKTPGVFFTDPYADIVKSFGEDRGTEMEITELKDALPFEFEFIIFDCCFMGGIETAYELRDKAEYIVASPTEILATGFPYDKVIQTNSLSTRQICLRSAISFTITIKHREQSCQRHIIQPQLHFMTQMNLKILPLYADRFLRETEIKLLPWTDTPYSHTIVLTKITSLIWNILFQKLPLLFS